MIDRILTTARLEELSFLACHSYTQKFSVADGYREILVTVIDSERVDAGIACLKAVLTWTRQFPEKLASLHGGGFSGEDVLNALNTISAHCNPNWGVRYGDDGDSLEYLFGCIKMLLTIFEYAKKHQMCVIHTIDKSVD
jgi:hypothetical protein